MEPLKKSLVDVPDAMRRDWLFGEDQARYLVAAGDAGAILKAAEKAGVPARVIGETGGDAVAVGGGGVPLAELRALHDGWLPDYMAVPS